jgi:hypothetical protein
MDASAFRTEGPLGIPAREQRALTEEVFEFLEERGADRWYRNKVALLHFAGHGVADAA